MATFELSTDDTERLTFYPDGTAMIIRYSNYSGKFHKAIMKMKEEDYYRWKNNRVLIQDALPHLDNEEREFLMTGYTPEEWAKIFPPEND